MYEKQRMADMAVEVLRREAQARAERIGETFEISLKAVLKTEVGQQLEKLRDGSHCGEKASHWLEDLAKEREQERARERNRARKEEEKHDAWLRFMRSERRELELRREGQLKEVLGEPLPEEPPTALIRLASEDRDQAEEGMVALMSNGKIFYKHIDALSEVDMPARIAAIRLRTTWLKERRDGGFVRREESL